MFDPVNVLRYQVVGVVVFKAAVYVGDRDVGVLPDEAERGSFVHAELFSQSRNVGFAFPVGDEFFWLEGPLDEGVAANVVLSFGCHSEAAIFSGWVRFSWPRVRH